MSFEPLKKLFFHSDVVLKHIQDGDVTFNSNDDGSLFIYKYSRVCAWEKRWSNVTLNCRGLVLDVNGEVIARGFKKFFNVEELSDAEVNEWSNNIKSKKVKVFDKEDGSLGLFFVFNGKLICCTQGSFESEQCVKAMDILSEDQNKSLIKWFSSGDIGANSTVLVEIVYPENKIVLDYKGESCLFLLGVIDNKNGIEYSPASSAIQGFKTPQESKIKSFKKLKDLNVPNKEGFVLIDEQGNKVKIKFEDYVSLHKAKSCISTKSIWESLKNFGYLDESLLSDVPDEIYSQIESVVDELRVQFVSLYDTILKNWFDLNVGEIEDKKDFALVVNKLNRPMSSLMFAFRDEKLRDSDIWNLIKPQFDKIF